MTIKKLRSGDRFKFNNDTFYVTRNWINDNIPLIAIDERKKEKSKFDFEGLEVEKLQRIDQFTLTDIFQYLSYLNFKYRFENNDNGYLIFLIPSIGNIHASYYAKSLDSLVKVIISDLIKPLWK